MKTPQKIINRLEENNRTTWFCTNWPIIREGLSVIRALSGNIIIRVACSLIISLGNTLTDTICSGK